MSPSLRSAFAILSIAVCTAAIPAQQPAQHDTNRLYLDVVVTPKSGAPVAGLQQQDFTVLDNKVAQPISSFEARSLQDDKVEVVLVLDAVNVNYSNMAYERSQLDKFLRANGGQLAHPTSLAFFTSAGLNLLHDQSTDGNALAVALGDYPIGLRQIRRSSEFEAFNRVKISVEALQSLATREAARPGRKIIVWVSPGWPLLVAPRVGPDSVDENKLLSEIASTSRLLQAGRITLYSVNPLSTDEWVGRSDYYERYLNGVTKPSQVELGDLGLQVLAIQSGGLALGGSNDVTSLLQRCVVDTTTYYEISFVAPPAEHNNEYHQLEVKLSNPSLMARTRTGHYADH
jgi:VWFA-related protein